jgi:small multidrug resistance pump
LAWLLLAMTVALEVAGTTLLKLSGGPTERPMVFAGSMVCYGLCFWALSLAFRTIPFTVAYAIWAGAGMALIVLIGVFWFREPMTILKLAFLTMITVGTVGLKVMDGK